MDPTKVEEFAKKENLKNDASLLKNPKLINQIYVDIDRLAKQNKFNSLEVPRNIFLTTKMFTADSGLLTATQKMKRPVAKKYFEKEIQEMYEQG